MRYVGGIVAYSINVVNNVQHMKRAGGPAFDWAARFNERVREALASRDHQALSEFERLDENARLAVPTPEHYLPLLYIAALQREDEQMSFAVDGYEMGSLGMLTAVAGIPAS